MVVLNVVITVIKLTEFPFRSLHFIVLGFFFGGEVSAVSDEAFKTGENLVPV